MQMVTKGKGESSCGAVRFVGYYEACEVAQPIHSVMPHRRKRALRPPGHGYDRGATRWRDLYRAIRKRVASEALGEARRRVISAALFWTRYISKSKGCRPSLDTSVVICRLEVGGPPLPVEARFFYRALTIPIGRVFYCPKSVQKRMIFAKNRYNLVSFQCWLGQIVGE